MESKSLQVIDAEVVPIKQESPGDQLKRAQEMATPLAKLIEDKKLFSNINGKKYTRVEGWVPLARFNGTIPREISNEVREDGSYVARVQLVNVDTGAILTEASAECGGPGEPMWQGRVPNARRSMAATRATGKACRLAYSWIMVLAGYEATPAEEMPTETGEAKQEHPRDRDASKFHRNGPDSYYHGTAKKDGRHYIAVIAGDKLAPSFLDGIGAKQGKDGKWYLEDNEDNLKRLDGRLNDVL